MTAWVALLTLLAPAPPQETAWPRTRAERTDYAETSTYADVVAFAEGLVAAGAPVSLEFIGASTEGRPIPLLVASRPRAMTPLEARRQRRPVVYVQANIHAGEVEGKEAILHLLRRYSQEEWGLLDELVLVVNPIYNSDGNEKLGDQARHRPSQDGPAQVGLRANGQGLDLNRDYVKAKSPEMQAALRHVWTAWQPDVFLDLHTTNGTRHGYPLTYAPPLSPLTDRSLLEFARDVFLPGVRAELEPAGLRTFDYGNVETRAGSSGWYAVSPEARFSTNYSGLVGCIGVLCESLTYLPFRQRVRDMEQFVDAVLRHTALNAATVTSLTAQADVSWLGPDMPTEAGVRFEPAKRGDEPIWLERPAPEGQPRRTGRPTDLEQRTLPIFDRFVPTRSRPVPAAYWFGPDHRAVAELLAMHGVTVERLAATWTGEAEAFVVSEVAQAEQPFQGHRLIRLEGTFEKRPLEASKEGFLVWTAQRLGPFVFHVLEPEGLDGAVAWGFFGESWAVGGVAPVWKLSAVPPVGRVRFGA
jgi:hypothetical protein